MTDRQAKVNAVAECYLVTGDERHVRKMSADQNLSEDVVAEGIALARAGGWWQCHIENHDRMRLVRRVY